MKFPHDPIEVRAWWPNSLSPFWGFVVRIYGYGLYVHTERPDEMQRRAGFDAHFGIGRPLVFFLHWHWLRPSQRGE